jgi:predicted lipoprotein with Yx(FWY)xxD motif
MKNKSLALFLIAGGLLAGCGGGTTSTTPPPHVVPTQTPSGTTVLTTATIDGGPAFVTSTGFAVYKFSGDTKPDVSTCTGGCAAVWPAVAPPSSGSLPSPWSSFTRSDDGATQLAYKGKPLYTFVNDTQPGVATGNGVNGFSIVRP